MSNPRNPFYFDEVIFFLFYGYGHRILSPVDRVACHLSSVIYLKFHLHGKYPIRRNRHAGQNWRSGPLHMFEQRQDDQLEPTYNSSVPIQDVALKTYRKQWTIEKGSGRGSGISVLVERHDDDNFHRDGYFTILSPLLCAERYFYTPLDRLIGLEVILQYIFIQISFTLRNYMK